MGASGGAMLRLAPALFLLFAVPSNAAERRIPVGSFDRVRVNGPVAVIHAPGSPQARVSGDARAIEGVVVRVEGSTLTVRAGALGQDEPTQASSATPVTVALSSPSLVAAAVNAGGRFDAARVRGGRVDLMVTGPGTITVADLTADQLSATLIGTGAMTLAGRAGRVRLSTNGSGRIDASGLRSDDLAVALDGPGETLATARYGAVVNNLGLGSVTVTGRPKCTVTARAGGPVRCGD